MNSSVSISRREWVSVSGRVTCSWRATIMRIFYLGPVPPSRWQLPSELKEKEEDTRTRGVRERGEKIEKRIIHSYK